MSRKCICLFIVLSSKKQVNGWQKDQYSLEVDKNILKTHFFSVERYIHRFKSLLNLYLTNFVNFNNHLFISFSLLWHYLKPLTVESCDYSSEITSVLILTQLSTELAEPNGTRGTVSILFGLDIKEFEYTIQGESNSRSNNVEIMVAFLLFSLTYAIASAILIWGSIVEQSWCALPWLICEAFSFATQISTLIIHAIALGTRKDKWIISVSILNIGLTFYFWIVVFCAQRTWTRQRRESKANEISASRHNTLKEDSYTNGSSSPLPSKYVQV